MRNIHALGIDQVNKNLGLFQPKEKGMGKLGYIPAAEMVELQRFFFACVVKRAA
jgi:hypothetical protein